MFIYKFKSLPLIFIFNAKCGCSNIKNIINDIDKLYETNDFHDVHKHKFTNINHKELLKNTTHHVIFFVRNPYHRFVSGYSKITNKLILKLRFDQSKSISECNKLIKDCNIDIDEWGKIITNVKPKNLEHHFKEQTFGMKNILLNTDIYYYDLDDLSNLKTFLNDKYNIHIDCNIRDKYNSKKKEPSNETKELIYEYYKHDFELLNYSKEYPT